MRSSSAAVLARRLAVGLLLLSALVRPAAAVAPVNKSFLGGLAIDGYDPVAYFTAGKPVAGVKTIATEWNGATWRFATTEHRELFVQSPEKYAPQYGGYCAWAVAHDYTADADPEAWTIVDGKLYLNYDRKILEKWKADIPGNVAKGDANWPGILRRD